MSVGSWQVQTVCVLVNLWAARTLWDCENRKLAVVAVGFALLSLVNAIRDLLRP